MNLKYWIANKFDCRTIKLETMPEGMQSKDLLDSVAGSVEPCFKRFIETSKIQS